MRTPLLPRFRGLKMGAQKFRKIDQEKQGFRARSHSVKSKREGAEAMLLEFFQDNECVTHAKRFVEASKIFFLSCNFKSPDSASTFLGEELKATPLVDELDELEKSAVHTASCVDLFLKKHECTNCASVLLGVNLRTTRLVYELESEKSAVCVAVFLARKDCMLALLGGELGATPLAEFEDSKKSALQTQIEIVLPNDRTDRMAVIWVPHDCGVDGLFVVALSWENKIGDDSLQKLSQLTLPS